MPPKCTCPNVIVLSYRGPQFIRSFRAWCNYWLEVCRQAKRSRLGLCAHWPLSPIRQGHATFFPESSS